ncbi:MAG: mannose-1-phosphate guanylyltransferase [Christensenellaceae bacterium]
MKIFGVIMAGGGGTRFWPLSRKARPKQLLNLSGRDLMINETLERLLNVTERENVYIVTNVSQVAAIKEAVHDRIPLENILSEPAARNTAACIGYAAAKILKLRGDGVMIVTPSDAYVKDEEEYSKVLKLGAVVAENGGIVTVGIKPTFPSTGYGYIKYEKSLDAVKKADCFVEKPDKVTAERYISEGGYAWNSGIFIWKASVVRDKIKRYLPDLYSDIAKIAEFIGTDGEREALNEVYPSIRSISIDYGVMEKSDDIKVIESDFGWNDVGSWDMLNVLHKADEKGNISVGDTIIVDSARSTVYSEYRTVAILGLDDIIVAETKDAVLVCPKSRAQDVKKIVEELNDRGKKDLL